MRDQLPNPIRFLIYYLASWSEGEIIKPKRTSLYQTYLEWCGENGEKPFSDSNLGKKFSQIGIDRTRLQINGKREYHYILDHPKIITKLRESGLGDIEEFSDTLQDDIPTNKGSQNETTDIPIFNMPETIPKKTISPQPERHNRVADRKNKPSPNTSKDKKTSNQDVSIQALFDYVAEDTRVPVASTFGTSETSKPPEQVWINLSLFVK